MSPHSTLRCDYASLLTFLLIFSSTFSASTALSSVSTAHQPPVLPPSLPSLSHSVFRSHPLLHCLRNSTSYIKTIRLPVRDVSEATDWHVVSADRVVALLYKGVDLMLDSHASPNVTTPTLAGLTSYELHYRRVIVSLIIVLKLLLNGTISSRELISHDQSDILPIVTNIDPPSGCIAGGVRNCI